MATGLANGNLNYRVLRRAMPQDPGDGMTEWSEIPDGNRDVRPFPPSPARNDFRT
jgi:hypothetical protein